jgi:hypothetical protein
MKIIFAHIKKHSGVYLVYLAVVIMVLLFKDGSGNKYTIKESYRDRLYVLDTKTGQVWLRMQGISIDMGTNDNPKFEVVCPSQEMADKKYLSER